MSKKNKRNRKPKGETKQNNADHNRQGKPMTAVIVTGLTLFGGLLLAAGGMLYGNQKPLAIWLFFFGTVCFALSITLHWRGVVIDEEDNPPFSVSLETGMQGVTRDSVYLGFEYNNQYISPLPVLQYIRVVNLQSVPATIDKFEIEFQKTKRSWWIFPPTWIPTIFVPEYMQLSGAMTRPKPLCVWVCWGTV
jgi:hypothetical protein